MNVNTARELCQKYVKMGMTEYQARNALLREGCDEPTVENALHDYVELRDARRKRNTRFKRLWGAALFAGFGGAFLFFAFLAGERVHVFHFWMLAPAIYGLLKMLLP